VELCVDLFRMLMALMPKKRRAARFTPKRSDDPPKSGGFLSGPPTTTYRLRLARRIGARRPGPELAEVKFELKNYCHVTRHRTKLLAQNDWLPLTAYQSSGMSPGACVSPSFFSTLRHRFQNHQACILLFCATAETISQLHWQ